MHVAGIIIHHSACSSINGKGYDFFITVDGSIISAAERTAPDYIHVCLEGDFSKDVPVQTPLFQETFFIFIKLLLRLFLLYDLTREEIFRHDQHCPGTHFPKLELVISNDDRYH